MTRGGAFFGGIRRNILEILKINRGQDYNQEVQRAEGQGEIRKPCWLESRSARRV